MHGLVRYLREGSFVSRLRLRLNTESRTWVEGGNVFVWTALLASLLWDRRHPTLIVAQSPEKLPSLVTDMETLLGQPKRLFPFPPHLTLLVGDTELSVLHDRIAAIDALHRSPNPIIVATPSALCQPTVPVSAYQRGTLSVRVKETLDRETLIAHLLSGGYERVSQVEAPGQFAVRGGIVDFFSPAHDVPIRIELSGEEVDSIRPFEVETQRSIGNWGECIILPAREFLLPDDLKGMLERIRDALSREERRLWKQGKSGQARLLRAQVEHDMERFASRRYFNGCDWYLPFAYETLPTLIDHLPPNTLVVWLEPHDADSEVTALVGRWEKICAELIETGDLLRPPRPPFAGWEEGDETGGAIKGRLQKFRTLIFTAEEKRTPRSLPLAGHRVEAFLRDVRRFLGRAKEWWRRGYAVVVATRYPQRVRDWLNDSFPPQQETLFPLVHIAPEETPVPGRMNVVSTPLSAGFVLPDDRLAVITDAELFNIPYKPRRKRWRGTVAVKSPSDLREGDYVVHVHHGIGIYRGLIRQEVLGRESDYLVIEYAGGEKLYVPVHQIDRVRRYVAIDGGEPVLSSLARPKSWIRLQRKARENAERVAKELLEIYARRKLAGGTSFSPDSVWQREMEEAFPYIETDDQLRAIEEVKADMEAPRPMNRLVCGDVGFGKTEIAVRAAFKAVQDNKQVAMLVPTTVLALQHFQTFRQRLAPYPVRIAMLSRLQPLKEQKAVIEGLKTGAIDVVIGTHRLLSDDIQFKDLGLLVIDEEQRFGVRQKERLKALQAGVDVLILTATPIPRTLHMALGGLLDLSLINTPPEGRRPVRTYLCLYDSDLVRFAIRRELERGGQVFYVYNRVQGIEHVAEKVKGLVPEAKVAIAHGRLPEVELERVMLEFAEGKWDVLVCTTIIENGLDVPNANTLIVENCERFGLAQLYQLRGRVGRSDRQAYAYFFHGHPKRMTENARRRLEALREFTDLGSGFRLALRDLEIRGAGNLLGMEQHGFINEVGFDLYLEMLDEAVRRLQGQPTPMKVTLPEADLPVKAFIPESYVEDLEQRLHLYRKMAGIQGEEDITAIEAELRDRYGPLPPPVLNLLSVLRLRVRAYKAGVVAITHDRYTVTVRFAINLNLTNTALIRLYQRLRENQSPLVLNTVRHERDRFLIEWKELSSLQLLRLLEDLLAALPEFLTEGKTTN